MGWVENRRDHGGLIFLDVRDRTGLVQVVIDPAASGMESSKEIRSEFVLGIEGKVRNRPDGMVNDKLATGSIEIEDDDFRNIQSRGNSPFPTRR